MLVGRLSAPCVRYTASSLAIGGCRQSGHVSLSLSSRSPFCLVAPHARKGPASCVSRLHHSGVDPIHAQPSCTPEPPEIRPTPRTRRPLLRARGFYAEVAPALAEGGADGDGDADGRGGARPSALQARRRAWTGALAALVAGRGCATGRLVHRPVSEAKALVQPAGWIYRCWQMFLSTCNLCEPQLGSRTEHDTSVAEHLAPALSLSLLSRA